MFSRSQSLKGQTNKQTNKFKRNQNMPRSVTNKNPTMKKKNKKREKNSNILQVSPGTTQSLKQKKDFVFLILLLENRPPTVQRQLLALKPNTSAERVQTSGACCSFLAGKGNNHTSVPHFALFCVLCVLLCLHFCLG